MRKSRWKGGPYGSEGFAVLAVVAFTAVSAYAQERVVGGAGRIEIGAFPGGGMFFTKTSNGNEPEFGNYALGGSFTLNVNRWIGFEGKAAERSDSTRPSASMTLSYHQSTSAQHLGVSRECGGESSRQRSGVCPVRDRWSRRHHSRRVAKPRRLASMTTRRSLQATLEGASNGSQRPT